MYEDVFPIENGDFSLPRYIVYWRVYPITDPCVVDFPTNLPYKDI